MSGSDPGQHWGLFPTLISVAYDGDYCPQVLSYRGSVINSEFIRTRLERPSMNKLSKGCDLDISCTMTVRALE